MFHFKKYASGKCYNRILKLLKTLFLPRLLHNSFLWQQTFYLWRLKNRVASRSGNKNINLIEKGRVLVSVFFLKIFRQFKFDLISRTSYNNFFSNSFNIGLMKVTYNNSLKKFFFLFFLYYLKKK